jgi:hypothetical protein
MHIPRERGKIVANAKKEREREANHMFLSRFILCLLFLTRSLNLLSQRSSMHISSIFILSIIEKRKRMSLEKHIDKSNKKIITTKTQIFPSLSIDFHSNYRDLAVSSSV